MLQRGTIISFNGSYYSGLASLTLETERGTQIIYCDNAPTARALDAAFGCITNNHCVDNEVLNGQEIFFQTDSIGILEGFVPLGELSEEEINELNNKIEEEE